MRRPSAFFILAMFLIMGYDINHVLHGAHSSVVERRFVVPKVEGSIPSGHPKEIKNPREGIFDCEWRHKTILWYAD